MVAQLTTTELYLSADHRQHIEGRGLLNQWATANCRTISADEASHHLGYTAKSGGILFLGSGAQIQFKPDKPWRSEGAKKAPKYRTPAGEYDAFLPQHPTDKDYWEPENLKKHCWRHNDIPCIVITEGPFKAISGCSNGIPTIALLGVSMGLTSQKADVQNKRYLVPALEKYANAGFGFIIAFDADATTNPNINWEQRKLGRQLLKFNVPVYSVTGHWDVRTEVEEGEIKETKGMDDFIQHKGIEAFRKVLATSLTFGDWESKTFDGDGGGGGGDGGSGNKYLVPKSTTFELHCWKNLFADDWIAIDDAFYQWNGRYWQHRNDADVNKMLAEFTEKCYEPAEVGKKFKFGTNNFLVSAFKYCRKALHKRVETSTTHLKSFANGTVDLRTGELFGHDKKHYLLSCSPCDYVAGSELPAEFGKFLLSAYGAEQVEVIRAVTSMYLDPTAPYGKFPYLLGNSGTGKGLLLRTWANVVGQENSVSSSSLSELTTPEGRHQLLTNKSLFYIPDTGGFLSGLKAFYELVDNGSISGRALYAPSGYQKKWNVRFAIASVEHIQTENSGDGWDRRCIPLQTRPRSDAEDPELGRKLSEELGAIAGWALSMDKAERDRILLVPSTNPAVVALKQEGAILGDSVRSFVDRCFRSGRESYNGSDLHSWYVAYCKAHNLSPQGYNKFVHHLQRVLASHWRASDVVRVGDKPKRVPGAWLGLQVLPCFVDLAVSNEDDSNSNSNRPHVESWVCLKTACDDGGLQELTENLVVTGVTGTSSAVTSSKNAETRMVTDVTSLQDESSRSEKISSSEFANDSNARTGYQPVTDVTPVTTPVTPTFEPSAKPCNNSKTCNKPQSKPEQSPIAPGLQFTPGDRVKVSAQYPGAQEYKGELATVVKVWSDGECRIELDREISVLEGKPKKQFNLDGDCLESAAADSNLNEDELELVQMVQIAVAEANPEVARQTALDILPILTKVCSSGAADKRKVWGALTAVEQAAFKALLAEFETQSQPEQLATEPHAPSESEPEQPTANTKLYQLDLLPDFKPPSDPDNRFSSESEDWL